MRVLCQVVLGCGVLTLIGGCPTATSLFERNPYLTYTEEYGVAGQQQTFEGGGGGGAEAVGVFRREMTVTFRNNNATAELNTTFVAWVSVSSIRSADQQDALLQGGYRQLTRETKLGTAFTLPPGTFVLDGGGTAGATTVFLHPGQAAAGENNAATPTTLSLTIITPDALLAFIQPPVSCESVAFYFSDDGQPLTGVPVADEVDIFGGAYGTGGFKTMAQVDAYQCSPFKPGLFLRASGGRQPDEYFEGENVTFDFNPTGDADGNFAIVTIGTAATTIPG